MTVTSIDSEQERLNHALAELRRIAKMQAELKKERDRYTAEVVPMLKELGSAAIVDPFDQQMRIATVVEAETLVVDAGKLYEALLEQYQGDVEQAEMIWKSVLKPPAVDSKDEGLFVQACAPRGEDQEIPPLISPETVVKCATFKKSAAYVTFGRA